MVNERLSHSAHSNRSALIYAVCGLAVALGRDDPFAIAAFVVVLLQGAILLQRRRAARAAARMST